MISTDKFVLNTGESAIIQVQQPNESHILYIKANSSQIEVFILHKTNYALFMREEAFTKNVVYENAANKVIYLNYDTLVEKLGAESMVSGEIQYYIVIFNNSTESINIVWDLRPSEPKMFYQLRDWARLNLIIVSLYVTVCFFIGAKIVKKENPEEPGHPMQLGFGIAFTVVFLNYLISTLDQWLRRDIYTSIIPPHTFGGTLIPFFAFRADQIFFILLICASQIIIIFEIEKNVIGRKVPYFSLILLSLMIFVLIGLGIEFILDIAILLSLLAQIIFYFYVCYFYFILAYRNEGTIRLKSLAMGIGLLLPVIMLILGEILYPPSLNLSLAIADMFSTAGLLLLKYGIAEEASISKLRSL